MNRVPQLDTLCTLWQNLKQSPHLKIYNSMTPDHNQLTLKTPHIPRLSLLERPHLLVLRLLSEYHYYH